MILLYHKVASEAPTQWWVTADTFNRQMAALAGYDVVHLDDYDASNPRHVCITFDGVYENVYVYAFPILRKWGYPFELFVTGDYIGGDNAFDSGEPAARFCTTEQLDVMACAAGRVQWHTASHRTLAGLDAAALRREIEPPAALAGQFRAPHMRWFAYPHGNHDAATVDAVRAGFAGALSCEAGNDHDRWQLNRLTVTEGTSLERNRVTVIVANYNYGRFLPEAMDSVLKQTVAPNQLILIDDCSTDGSQEVAMRYADVADVVLNETNLGIVDNFNKAVSLATGDYIAFLGADNRMRSDYVERCRAALDADEAVAVAYTDMTIFGHRASQLAESVSARQVAFSNGERWPVFLWTFPDPDEQALATLATRNFIHGSSMYRRSVFQQVGGYRASGGPEDHHLFLRMVQSGWRVRRVPHPLIEYRQHGAGQANTVLGTQMELAQARHRIVELDRALAVAAQRIAEAQRVQEEAQRLQAEAQQNQQHIHALLTSTSWRVTKPLRFIGLITAGRHSEARERLWGFIKRQLRSKLPPAARTRLMSWRTLALGASRLAPETSTDLSALQPMTDRRLAFMRDRLAAGGRARAEPTLWPAVDISAVLHNNGRWLDSFTDSILHLDYPLDRLRVILADNGSTDATPQQMQSAVERLRAGGIEAVGQRQNNVGFGAGHNAALARGSAPYCLVTNVDLTFTNDALRNVVALAAADPKAAAWELRQKPYEHPKYYDPITWETNWNSHACVLLRRDAFERLGGYDDNLFMYGEDVELSYRLRREGWLLRYCPDAVVFHYSYETAGEVKPLQYTGSTFANLYLRLKYGTARDMALVPAMALGLLLRPEPFPGARSRVLRNIARLLAKVPAAVAARRRSDAEYPFRLWDYELRRDGAFHPVGPLPDEQPLISVITRTYQGRERFLEQAIVSVARQTWRNVELVVVQDGGGSLRPLVEALAEQLALMIRFVPAPKVGRSAAGNAGLAASTGRWCLFLDDDDLLFADHLEVLAQAMLANTAVVAAYSPAWEVQTVAPEPGTAFLRETAYTIPPPLREPFNVDGLARQNLMAVQSVLFEKRLWEERGGFDTELDALEDWVLWNVYASGNVFQYVPKLTSLFRTPADAAVRARRSEVLHAAYEIARVRFAERIKRLGSPTPGTQGAATEQAG